MIKKILVIGSGYVGGSLGTLLAKKYEVVMIDKDPKKVADINNKKAPISEPNINEHLTNTNLKISACDSYETYLNNTDLIILALPTNYDEVSDYFDTEILESVFQDISNSSTSAIIVIKSTIPIGFTKKIKARHPNLSIIFVPEFLREGKAIEDNEMPSRIVIGDMETNSFMVAEVFKSIAKNSPKILYMSSNEAEAVKLFANTYLASRVSFFNELDTFALENNLNTKNIIDGISLDKRIGEGYNNPSFGYGGYCLPKDTKQLLANFKNTPQKIFSAVVESNNLRKKFIAKKILDQSPNIVGIYRLIMKKDSENFRESAIFDILKILEDKVSDILIYEPLLEVKISGSKVTHNLEFFKENCDLIIANRIDESLIDVQSKVFTRDVYGNN